MPKSFAPELLSHYQQSQTTLARCLRIERQDGKVIAFTEHDVDINMDGVNYQSAAGYVLTAISMQDKGNVHTIDVNWRAKMTPYGVKMALNFDP